MTQIEIHTTHRLAYSAGRNTLGCPVDGCRVDQVILKDDADINLSSKFDLLQGGRGEEWPLEGKGDDLKSLSLLLLVPPPILFTKGRCNRLK